MLYTPEYSPQAYHIANKVSAFFDRKGCRGDVPCADDEWVLKFTAEQLKWLRYFRIEHTAEKFIANTVAESYYNPEAESEVGAYGATQVYSEAWARRALEKRGVTVGPLTDYRAQAALGVTIYYLKLKKAKGDPWLAVKYYNGGGKVARQHKNKVWRYHRDIFKGGV